MKKLLHGHTVTIDIQTPTLSLWQRLVLAIGVILKGNEFIRQHLEESISADIDIKEREVN